MSTRNLNGKCVNCPCAWWWCGDNKDCWLNFQERKGIKVEPPKIPLKSSVKPKKRKSLKHKLTIHISDEVIGNIYLCQYCSKALTYDIVTVDRP